MCHTSFFVASYKSWTIEGSGGQWFHVFSTFIHSYKHTHAMLNNQPVIIIFWVVKHTEAKKQQKKTIK